MRILIIALTSFTLFSCDLLKKEKDAKIDDAKETDKILYTMGQMYAQRIEFLRLNEKEVEFIARGIKDWTLKKHSEYPLEQYRSEVQKFVSSRMTDVAKDKKKLGQDYMTKFLADGGKITPSGLGYKITNPGSSVKPLISDSVEVHYHGTFIDGKVFDSSVDRKEKATLPMDSIIKGWQEGLQLIGEGGEIDLVVPSDLAYGDQGSLPTIPGGSTLLFKITLFKVNKK